MKLLKDVLKVTFGPVLLASLCCLSPVLLFTFGIATTTYAASLADLLYGEYVVYFRLLGAVALIASLVLYFHKHKWICSLDELIKKRRVIINFSLISLIVACILYIFWLYGIVHVWWVWEGLWN